MRQPTKASCRAPAPDEFHAAELERLNDELKQVAARATKLLDVTTALSEATSVQDVTDVVLNKGGGHRSVRWHSRAIRKC